MAYPTNIDKFSDKLNKSDKAYVIEEEVVVSNGVYEALLNHDNIVDSSVSVWTGSKLTGDKVVNFILSIPSATPWKRSIKIFSSVSPVFVTYETFGDQIEADDVNQLQNSMSATQMEVDRYKSANDLVVSDTVNRVKTLENKKADKTYVDAELLKKSDKENTYTKTETDARIQAVVDAAPEALDTLIELAAALNNDPDFAGTMTIELSKKVDKVPGKQLSTEDYTTAEKAKLANVETGANKYIHPSTHPATMIVEDSAHRFVSDAEKVNWNGKETPEGAQVKATAAQTSAIDWVKSMGLGQILSARATSNCDTAKVTGFYYVSSSATTRPSGSTDGAMFVMTYDSNLWVTQLYIDWRTNRHYTRVCSNGTWSAWAELETVTGAQAKVDAHANDVVKHITSTERTKWNTNQKNSDITKAEIEAKLTGNITTHSHSQYVTQEQLGNAGYGDMLKSVYDSNGDGIVDKAALAMNAENVPWTGVTGKPTTFAPTAHTHDVLKNKPDNWRDGLSLPSTYDHGQTIFHSDNPANKFNNVPYCTVHTIRGYSGFANCIQYIYPYNVDAPIMYRYCLYNSNSWKEWRRISIEGHTHSIANISGLQSALDGKMKKGALTWNDLKGV